MLTTAVSRRNEPRLSRWKHARKEYARRESLARLTLEQSPHLQKQLVYLPDCPNAVASRHIPGVGSLPGRMTVATSYLLNQLRDAWATSVADPNAGWDIRLKVGGEGFDVGTTVDGIFTHGLARGPVTTSH